MGLRDWLESSPKNSDKDFSLPEQILWELARVDRVRNKIASVHFYQQIEGLSACAHQAMDLVLKACNQVNLDIFSQNYHFSSESQINSTNGAVSQFEMTSSGFVL